MDSILSYILKSTLGISLLYAGFRLFMRKEAFFALNRSILLLLVVFSMIVPLITLPIFFEKNINKQWIPAIREIKIIQDVQPTINEQIPPSAPISPKENNRITDEPFYWGRLIPYFYLTGIAVMILLLTHGIFSVLRILRKASIIRKEEFILVIVNNEISPFSFGRYVIISAKDYESYQNEILTHELAHVRLKHFYDLALLEVVKILHWFNPVIYLLIRDIKEIHEFQADENTINTGIDAKQYQFLIIQKTVGEQRFALANSFNHCQIKKRITMINKQKNGKAWRWKVATFLPMLALLLMAFGKTNEKAPIQESISNELSTSDKIIQSSDAKTERTIEIKNGEYYIDQKICSLDEVVNKGKEWTKASNGWITLSTEEQMSGSAFDQVFANLKKANVYHIVLKSANADDQIYFMGDVSEMAKFSEGKWDEWMKNSIKKHVDLNKEEFNLSYFFIVDKNGKVQDTHLIKKCQYPEINNAYEKALSQIPDWQPAKRGGKPVSAYFYILGGNGCIKPL